jgi:hypothetical protein
MESRKEVKAMTDYYLANVDNKDWEDFKSLCALEGVSVRGKLLQYIRSEVKFFRSARFDRETVNKIKEREDKSWRAKH